MLEKYGKALKHGKIIVPVFFLLYFLIGAVVFKDYGISWDELPFRTYTVNSIRNFASYEPYKNIFVFPSILVLLETAFNLVRDERNLFLFRHFSTFLLFFAAAYCFYKICKNRFKSWKVGLLGAVFLILSPRIFAHSFYSPKDIPFLCFFIFAVYTLINYLDDKLSIKKMALHAFTTALLINTHGSGAIIVLFTVVFLIAGLKSGKHGRKFKVSAVLNSIAYFIILIFLLSIVSPSLINKPLSTMFRQMHISNDKLIAEKTYAYSEPTLYMGKAVNPNQTPWHYNVVWMGITIPPMYIIFFAAGVIKFFLDLWKVPKTFFSLRKDDAIFFLWLFIPLIAPIIFRSTLYDSWRHHFFVYPAFVIFSLYGVTAAYNFIKAKIKTTQAEKLSRLLTGVIAAGCLITAFGMIRYHPFQNVYFNSFVGGIKGAHNNFDLDYWGLSYKKGYEYILKNDSDDAMVICVDNFAGRANMYSITKEERKRMLIVNYPPRESYVYFRNDSILLKKPKYLITNHRWQTEKYKYPEAYSLKIDTIPIMTIYKL